MSNCDYFVGVMLYALKAVVSLRVIANFGMELNMDAIISFLICVVVGTALQGRSLRHVLQLQGNTVRNFPFVVNYIGESAGGFDSLLAPPVSFEKWSTSKCSRTMVN